MRVNNMSWSGFRLPPTVVVKEQITSQRKVGREVLKVELTALNAVIPVDEQQINLAELAHKIALRAHAWHHLTGFDMWL